MPSKALRPEDLLVEHRDRDLVRRGSIPVNDLKLKFQPVYNGVGSWILTLPSEHRAVPYLRTPGAGIVITNLVTGEILMSGSTSKPSKKTTIADPKGMTSIAGLDDNRLAFDARAFQMPSNADVSTQTVSHDVRTGPGSTIMRAYVDANIGPASPVGRRGSSLRNAIVMGADPVVGITTTQRARQDNLGELLNKIAAEAGGVGWRFVQVGDTIEFQTYAPVDRSAFIRLDVANGTLQETNVEFAPPEVTRSIVAGQGELVERQFVQVTTTESLQAEEDWGLIIEDFKDQRQTGVTDELEAAGVGDLNERGFTKVAVKAVPSNDQTMIFLTDFFLGDRVAVVIDGQEQPNSNITEAAIVIDENGMKTAVAIGDVADFDSDSALRQTVTDNTRRISAIERNIEMDISVPVGTTTRGVLAFDYRYGGRAMVRLEGDTVETGPYEWQGEYTTWAPREVSLIWTGDTWEIQRQVENVAPIAINFSEWDGYGRIQMDRGWNDRYVATKLPSGLVVLGGLLRGKATPTTGGLVGTLPVGFRPEFDIILPVEYGDNARGVIVKANGEIRTEGSSIATQYLSLDGVAFWASDSEATGNWTDVGAAGSGSSFGANFGSFSSATYGPVGYYKDRYGFVWFRGLLAVNVTTSVDNTSAIVLPASHRAISEQHYRTIGWGGYSGLGARTTDGLNWKSGSVGSTGTYISPSGAVICTTDAANTLNKWFQPQGLLNSWVQYGAGFPYMQWTRRGDGLVMLRGMVANGTVGAAMTNMIGSDETVARGRRLILAGIANNNRCRIDIVGLQEDTGRGPKDVYFGSTSGGTGWVSVDGMCYVP